MKDEVIQIIQIAKKLKNDGYSDKRLAEFIHIELGKLIIYNNNYTFRDEDYDIENNIEGHKSKDSVIRQKKILNERTDLSNREQVCRGMAEIYTAILSELGINAKVVGVESKEEVDGDVREDGSVIDVPEVYKTSFDSDLSIIRTENEKNNNSTSGHYYTVIQTDEGEFIQDFLTEKALTRIKIGEAQLNEIIPGFHKKEEHKTRVMENVSNIAKEYMGKMREELYEYMQEENDDSKVFSFIFNKLCEKIDKFGFEESKDFVMMFAQSIIPRAMIKQKIIPINLVKEDEENCDVLCIYRCGTENFLMRGRQNKNNLPIGEIANEIIEKLISQGFTPRKLKDAKRINELQMENIVENNKKINEMIQRIIELRRSQRISFEKNGKIDEQMKEILEMETEKCLEIYKIEFPEYQCQGKRGVTFVESETADCYGGINGFEVTLGMQDFIDKRIMPFIKEKGYSIDENGKAFFDSNVVSNLYHDTFPKLNNENEYKYVGCTKDQYDYFASLFAKNGIDMDWVLDVLPHEAMHTFGVTGGYSFLKEGITEELAREICEKYRVHMTPTSHTKEAEFVRKLEMVVGRDKIISSGMWTGKFVEKYFKDILENNSEMNFEELADIFKLLRYESKELDQYIDGKQRLEKFSEKYPEIVMDLKEKVELYRKQDIAERYSDVAKSFDKQLGLKEGSFFKYAEVLENFYSLSRKHKLDPKFYRDVYSLNLEELQKGYQLSNGRELSKEDKNILSNIETLFNGLSQDNNMQINSFENLMSPINEYIKDKDLETNSDYKDFSAILEIQQREISMLQEITREQNAQKNEQSSEDMEIVAGISDFEQMDIMVSAEQRKNMISNIRRERQQIKEGQIENVRE